MSSASSLASELIMVLSLSRRLTPFPPAHLPLPLGQVHSSGMAGTIEASGVAWASKQAFGLVSPCSQSTLPTGPVGYLHLSPQTLRASFMIAFQLGLSTSKAQLWTLACYLARVITGLGLIHPRERLETREQKGINSCFSGLGQKSLQLFPDIWRSTPCSGWA